MCWTCEWRRKTQPSTAGKTTKNLRKLTTLFMVAETGKGPQPENLPNLTAAQKFCYHLSRQMLLSAESRWSVSGQVQDILIWSYHFVQTHSFTAKFTNLILKVTYMYKYIHRHKSLHILSSICDSMSSYELRPTANITLHHYH